MSYHQKRIAIQCCSISGQACLVILKPINGSPHGWISFFPTLFASHPLVGKNHTALSDIQMLQLLILLLIELQKPPSERDLRRFPQTTQQFVTRGQLPYTALEKWLGVGYNVVSDPVSEAQADEMITELVGKDERDEIYDPDAEARLRAEIVLELQEDYELDVEYEAKMELQLQEDEEDGL